MGSVEAAPEIARMEVSTLEAPWILLVDRVVCMGET